MLTLRIAALVRQPSLGLFLLLLVSYAYFFPRWADWNENSHFALTQALVEEHTVVIDDYYQQTGDYAVFGGHQYTDKAPGLSILAAPFYAAFRAASGLGFTSAVSSASASNAALATTLQPNGTGIRTDKVEYAVALYVVTFFTVSVPAALLWLLVYRFLVEVGLPAGARLIVVLASGLGTVAFPYATVFYSHLTAAFLGFLAFYLLFQIKREKISASWLFGVGAVLGVGVFTDFPSIVTAGILLAYTASFARSRAGLGRIVAGALPCTLLLALYNDLCFGSPLASSYRYLALFPAQRDYGFLGFAQPTWSAFWGITFSPYRGLFFSSPFLLAIVPGALQAWRSGWWRAELTVAGSVVVSYLALISCYYDWRGGFSVAGPRNLIPIIPFAALPVASGLSWAWKRTYWRPIVGGAVAWSLVATLIQTAGGQAFAPITIPNPLFEFFWPRFLEGDMNRNLGMVLRLSRWYSLAPMLAASGLLAVALWCHERSSAQ